MQGFNMGRYVPPEHEGTISANKLAGKHALGARANKIKDGILTVRFELPFAIWCRHCPPETLIGQGVRFNAEKKKVGHYHSTPIYSFRMRHPACGGWIEIRTDPQNTEYVVMEGATKRDYGEWKQEEEGEGKIMTEEERQKRREDAFAMLEGKAQDKAQAKMEVDRIAELKAYRDRTWEDPYTKNQKLRALFRPGRKLRQQKEEETERLQERFGLGMDLLEGTEEDAQRAKLVEFGNFMDDEEAALQAARKPLFSMTAPKSGDRSGLAKGRKDKPKASEILAATVQANTRAKMDPFLIGNDKSSALTSTGRAIPGLKRRRSNSEDRPAPKKLARTPETPDTPDTTDTNDDAKKTTITKPKIALVAYDSDDD